MNVFTTVRDWWLRPVTDRLEEIARNTRPAPLPPVEPTLHVESHLSASDQRAFVRAELERIAAREARVDSGGRPYRNTEDR